MATEVTVSFAMQGDDPEDAIELVAAVRELVLTRGADSLLINHRSGAKVWCEVRAGV